ncbi:beta-hexosaminidase [Apiospora rasikravindrae]|uniref:Beta-hexosaminidase n=1 Tax=Apiospora rasikravindrae TaxID=990691 RepID=A0ABR1TFC4_9PEZI
MAHGDGDLDPLWQDLDWAIGQTLIMGWDGTEITPQIRSLIEEHHLGSILLTAKNLKCKDSPSLEFLSQTNNISAAAEQTASLVQELQTIAHQAGHPHPLLIALDQENGGVNSLFDEDYICQFPSAMGIAAAGSTELAYSVAKATATEISAVGVNLILGPVLDVLTNARHQPLGVRAIGDDPPGSDAGVATCGKHFPSYGNLDFLGSSLDMPIITQTLEELSLSALVPFRNAIATGRLDAMFIGGVGIANAGMNVMHACLSEQVVDDLLRNDLGFSGVAISECLEMESLIQEYGVKGGTVMAVEAGNDLVLLCRAHDVQLEAISGLKLGIENGIISKERIHTLLQEEELLLLTPLVKPLPASAATKSMMEKAASKIGSVTMHEKWVHQERGAIMSGEGVFRELGRSIARARHGKLLHTSYTANGLRPVHENLIHRASSIILVTADANRNLYQSGFTKHIAMMCQMLRATGQKKSLIVVAVSSPYDFAMDKSIGTYICTFDFTETAMASLVRALYGDFVPQGSMPGTMRKAKKVTKSRQQWLVESYDHERDSHALDELLSALARSSTPSLPYSASSAHTFQLFNPSVEEAHYVVRNSSTQALYGFVATYYTKGLGSIGAIFVDPAKRNVSIGRSLHRRAVKTLLQRSGIQKIQLGTAFPAAFLGVPVDDQKTWFTNIGWDTQFPRRLTNMIIEDLHSWAAPEGLAQSIQRALICFDLIQGLENAESVLNLVATHATPDVVELYKFALTGRACGVVRAKTPADDILATVIVCPPGSHLANYVPALQFTASSEVIGGIIAPIVPSTAQSTLLLQGLALMGLRQNKGHKATRSVLSYVLEDFHEPLAAMGFDVQQTFDEITNSPDTFVDAA